MSTATIPCAICRREVTTAQRNVILRVLDNVYCPACARAVSSDPESGYLRPEGAPPRPRPTRVLWGQQPERLDLATVELDTVHVDGSEIELARCDGYLPVGQDPDLLPLGRQRATFWADPRRVNRNDLRDWSTEPRDVIPPMLHPCGCGVLLTSGDYCSACLENGKGVRRAAA